MSDNDAKFVAAADPATVLWLIREVRRLDREVRHLRPSERRAGAVSVQAQARAEKAEAAVQRARDAAVSIIAAVEDWQNNEHEAAMKELREWQRRAEVAEAEGQRLRGVLEETVYSWMQKAETLEAEVVNLSKELVLAKATIQRVRGVINEGHKHRGWGYDDDYDSGWDGCANDVERALVVVPDE
jgi:predicted  nucleic acid-binding Zn-ribbon protein